MFSLKNKIALVTGASRGIGYVISEKLSMSGAHVICISRTEIDIRSLSEKIKSNGGSASYYQCDISNKEAVENLITSVLNDYGQIDILVNNAGITKDSLLLRMNDEQWNNVLKTNLNSAFYTTKGVIKSMIKNRFGRIINISSIVGLTGNQGQGNYSASKAGLIGFSKSIAKEIATRGITVNCIAPGFIETEMTKNLSENIRENILKKIPMKKIGKPDDIANAVLFLASNEASYITGQTITIDGGSTIN